MSRTRVGPGVLALLSLARPAGAELPPDTGLEVGGRIGYAVALGDVADDAGALNDTVRGVLPLWFDLGYRVVPELTLGAYLQIGFGFLGDDVVSRCDAASLDCTTFDLRAGIQGQLHFRPTQRVDPWVGAGIGYEWLTVTENGAAAGDASTTFRGWELLNLQAGVDFLPRKGVGVGPFASFALGRFDGVTRTVGDDTESTAVDSAALHQWLWLGVRGTFVL